MINYRKIIWHLRAVFKKPFFGKIGKQSYFGKPIYASGLKRLFLGKRCRVFPNARIEIGPEAKIVIGDNCSIGQGLHIASYFGPLTVGSSVTISSNVFISNVEHSFVRNQSCLETALVYKETKIGNYCFIGVGAKILPGTILGDNCIVGAGAVIKGVFPDNSIIVGVPGRIIGEVNDD